MNRAQANIFFKTKKNGKIDFNAAVDALPTSSHPCCATAFPNINLDIRPAL